MSFPREAPIRMCIRSTTAHLAVVRAAAQKVCRQIGFDEQDAGRVVLSVDEALTNVIRHAYDGAADQPIEIEFCALGEGSGEGIAITLRDYGRQVDVSEIRSRDLEDLRPGGLGVHIMNECMDSLQYARAEGGGTVLTMTKRLPSQASERSADDRTGGEQSH